MKRTAKLKGKLASWDGARQKMRIIGGNDLGQWSGSSMAYSIKLEVFDDNGNWLMITYGGISLPVVAVARNRELVRKQDLFEQKSDYKGLVRWVEKALLPFKKLFKI